MLTSMFRMLLLLSIMIGISGCRKNTQQQAVLSAEELLTVMGGVVFEVRLPDDIESGKQLGPAIRYADGRVQPVGFTTTQLAAGTTVKFVILAPENNQVKCILFQDVGSTSGLIPRFPEHKALSANDKTTGLQIGDSLIKYSKDGKPSHHGQLNDGDFEIILHLE